MSWRKLVIADQNILTRKSAANISRSIIDDRDKLEDDAISAKCAPLGYIPAPSLVSRSQTPEASRGAIGWGGVQWVGVQWGGGGGGGGGARGGAGLGRARTFRRLVTIFAECNNYAHHMSSTVFADSVG